MHECNAHYYFLSISSLTSWDVIVRHCVVEVNLAPTRKLTSDVWLKMTNTLVCGEWKAYCNYYNKPLSAGSKSGTSHLRDHHKCNGSEKSPLLELLVFASLWHHASSCIYHLPCFCQKQNYFAKPYLYLVWFYNKSSSLFSYFK
jgi:hypothetical protein